MTKILAGAFSIAASLIISWAALHYDSALLVAGLLILLVVTLIWIFVEPRALTTHRVTPLRRDEVPPELDPKERALFYLERARENGYTAYANRSRQQIDQSLNEILSALRGVAKAYSFGKMNVDAEGVSNRHILELALQYIDSFYFLLRQGHVAEARHVAATFEVS